VGKASYSKTIKLVEWLATLVMRLAEKERWGWASYKACIDLIINENYYYLWDSLNSSRFLSPGTSIVTSGSNYA
jgi:hypothetical protein